MSNELARKSADSYRVTLAELWAAADGGALYEDQEPLEYLEEMALEVVYEVGEPFAVVLGTGGPHVEITGGGRSGRYYELTVYWAGERVSVTSLDIDRTGEYFRGMVDDQ